MSIDLVTLTLQIYQLLKNNCPGLWLLNRRSYLWLLFMVAAGEIFCPSDNSGWKFWLLCIIHLYLYIKLNRDACCFFSVESRDYMFSASCELRKMSNWKGVQYVKILLLRCIHHFKSDIINKMDHMRISGTEPVLLVGMPTVCWKTFPTKIKKTMSTRNLIILLMSSSVFFLLESECSFKIARGAFSNCCPW